jgi:hypothetical protein
MMTIRSYLNFGKILQLIGAGIFLFGVFALWIGPLEISTTSQTDREGWLDQTPLPILVSGSLMIFFIIVLHIPLLFNGIFPFFGRFTSGSQGVQLIDLSVIVLIFLTWGVLSRKRWAWWGSVLYFILLIITSTMTFLTNPPGNLLARMKFVPLEQEIFQKAPIHGYYFVFFFGLPLLITLVIFLTTGQYYERKQNL